jgi:predicted nucleic acid-binding protein
MLLDTNVVSEIRKIASGRVAPEFLKWQSSVPPKEAKLSVITVQEIELGILRLQRRGDSAQAQVFQRWLEDYVLVEFRHRILPVTTEIAQRSAKYLVDGDRSCEDSLIAATAYVHGLPVVTRNVGDFKGTGVQIIDPWQRYT